MRRFLHHLFFPHESNNHRAKLLHIDSLIITVSLLFFTFLLLSPIQNKYPSVLGLSYNITPTELLNITNQTRLAHGLTTLKLDSDLSNAASAKASNMFTKNYWAHIAPDGATPWGFIKNSGYEYLYAGENLARGFSNTSDVVNAWMASPTHRDNMLSPNYSDVGFAIGTGTLTGSETILVVEMFGTRYKTKTLTENIPQPTSRTALVILPTIPPPPISQPLSNHGTRNTYTEVAALQQQPLIDRKDSTRNTIIAIILIFVGVLILDAIIIERKKIARIFSHNLDHIIYLLLILSIIILMGGGIVL